MCKISCLLISFFIASVSTALPLATVRKNWENSLSKALDYVKKPRKITDIGSLMLKFMLVPENIHKDEIPKTDPFARLFSEQLAIPGLRIERLVKSKEDAHGLFLKNNKKFKNYFYTFTDTIKAFLTHAYDDVLAKALYCQETGYDDVDASIVLKMRDFEGGYMDTHALLAIFFLEEKGCVSKDFFTLFKQDIVKDLVKALEKDQQFSDLYAERVACLFWVGRGDLVTEKYIKMIVSAQKENGSWESFPGFEDMHTVGLSAVVLKSFLAGAHKVPFLQQKEVSYFQ